jgi:hypothetical protein
VRHPDNLKKDLPDPDELTIQRIFPEWEGSEGEQIFEVRRPRKEVKAPAKKKFVLVYDTRCGMRCWRGAPDAQGKMSNDNGTYCFLSRSDIIEETAEAEYIEDLDWTKSSILVPDSKSGWLGRDGQFFGCLSQDHDLIARLVLKQEVRTLEETGWVRLYEPPKDWRLGGRPGLRLSMEQRRWMSEYGYSLTEED